MNIKPLGKRVLLQVVEVEEKTKGGLILPGTTSKEAENVATVIALGTDKEVEENLKAGDKVVFDKYDSTKIKDGDKEYIIVDFEKVMAIVD